MPLPLPSSFGSPRLLLRPVERKDLPSLLIINGDDEVTRYLPYPSWKSLTDAEAWLQRMAGIVATGTALQYVIEERSSARVIGSCLLFHYEEERAQAEIGYVLGRAHWGKGLAREAMALLLEHAFVALGLRRLEANVDLDNFASARLLVTLGFVREACWRQGIDGSDVDADFYGLLREEWQRTRPLVPNG